MFPTVCFHIFPWGYIYIIFIYVSISIYIYMYTIYIYIYIYKCQEICPTAAHFVPRRRRGSTGAL